MNNIYFILTHLPILPLLLSGGYYYLKIRDARDMHAGRERDKTPLSTYSFHHVPIFEKINKAEPENIRQLVFIRNVIAFIFWLDLLLILITAIFFR